MQFNVFVVILRRTAIKKTQTFPFQRKMHSTRLMFLKISLEWPIFSCSLFIFFFNVVYAIPRTQSIFNVSYCNKILCRKNSKWNKNQNNLPKAWFFMLCFNENNDKKFEWRKWKTNFKKRYFFKTFIVLHSITISDDQKTNDAVETVDNKSKE